MSDNPAEPTRFDRSFDQQVARRERARQSFIERRDDVAESDIEELRRTDDGRFEPVFTEGFLRDRAVEQIVSERDDVSRGDITGVERTEKGFQPEFSQEFRRQQAREQIAAENEGVDVDDIATVEETDEGFEAEFTEQFRRQQARKTIAEDNENIDQEDIESVDITDDGYKPEFTEAFLAERAKEQIAQDVEGYDPEDFAVNLDEDEVRLDEEARQQRRQEINEAVRERAAALGDVAKLQPGDFEVVREGGDVVAVEPTEQIAQLEMRLDRDINEDALTFDVGRDDGALRLEPADEEAAQEQQSEMREELREDAAERASIENIKPSDFEVVERDSGLFVEPTSSVEQLEMRLGREIDDEAITFRAGESVEGGGFVAAPTNPEKLEEQRIQEARAQQADAFDEQLPVDVAAEDVQIRETDDGVRASLADPVAEQAAVEQIDEEIGSADIDEGDVVIEDGRARLSQKTARRVGARNLDPSVPIDVDAADVQVSDDGTVELRETAVDELQEVTAAQQALGAVPESYDVVQNTQTAAVGLKDVGAVDPVDADAAEFADTGSAQRQAGALSMEEQIRASVISQTPAEAEVMPSEVSVDRRQVSGRATAIASAAGDPIGVDVPEEVGVVDTSLAADAQERVLKQQVADEEGVPVERVEVGETDSGDITTRVGPGPLFESQREALGIPPGTLTLTTRGGGVSVTTTETDPEVAGQTGVVRSTLQDASRAYQESIVEPVAQGDVGLDFGLTDVATTSVEDATVPEAEQGDDRSPAEVTVDNAAAGALLAADPAGAADFGLAAAEFQADRTQYRSEVAADQLGVIDDGPGIEDNPDLQLAETTVQASDQLAQSAAENPYATGGKAVGFGAAVLLPAGAPRLRGRVSGRVSSRPSLQLDDLAADTRAQTGGRFRGSRSTDDVADAADETVTIEADDIIDSPVADNPSTLPSVRAMREAAERRFARFNEGRETASPSGDTGPGGEFTAESVSGRDVPDTGVDTARSGPTESQSQAFRSSLTDSELDELSPRERQLVAQGRSEPADFLDDVEEAVDSAAQESAAASGSGVSSGQEGALAGLLAAQSPSVSPFDEAEGVDAAESGRAPIIESGAGSVVAGMALLDEGVTSAQTPRVESSTPDVGVFDEAMVGGRVDASLRDEAGADVGVAPDEAVNTGVDVAQKTDYQTEQRAQQQRGRQRGREQVRERGVPRQPDSASGPVAVPDPAGDGGRRQRRGGSNVPRRVPLPELERDEDDEERVVPEAVGAAEERDIYELPDPTEDFLDGGDIL